MKFTIYAYWKQYEWQKEPILQLHMTDMTGYENGSVFDSSFEVDLPVTVPGHAEIAKARVAELRKEVGKHQHEIDKINDAIMRLQCIEHKPDEVIS